MREALVRGTPTTVLMLFNSSCLGTYILRRGINQPCNSYRYWLQPTTLALWWPAHVQQDIYMWASPRSAKSTQQRNLDYTLLLLSSGVVLCGQAANRSAGKQTHCEPCNLHVNDSWCKSRFMNHTKSAFRFTKTCFFTVRASGFVLR